MPFLASSNGSRSLTGTSAVFDDILKSVGVSPPVVKPAISGSFGGHRDPVRTNSSAEDVSHNTISSSNSISSIGEYIQSAAAMSQANSAFNAAEAQKNRDWQERMSNTAHQREVADLLAAGLNPVLSVTGGSGASSGTGSQAVSDSSANPAIAGMISSLLSSNATLSAAALASSASQYTAEVNNPLGTLLHGSATTGKSFLSLVSKFMFDEFKKEAGWK